MRTLYICVLLFVASLAFTVDDLCELKTVSLEVSEGSVVGSFWLTPCADGPFPDECEGDGLACARFGARWATDNTGSKIDRLFMDKNKKPTVLITNGDRCYSGTVSGDHYATRITFHCDRDMDEGVNRVEVGSNFPKSECLTDEQTVWTFDWYLNADWVCKQRSVFVTSLYFLGVGAIMYIGIGMTYKGVVQGMTGVEMVPNVDFWREVPSRVWSGIKALIDKIRGRGSYAAI
ncbi:hypothetical protein P9112_012504 [Eukaryota sp. TZLM1-RC]